MKTKTTLAALAIFLLVAMLATALVLGSDGPLGALFGYEVSRLPSRSRPSSISSNEATDAKDDEFVSEKSADGEDKQGPYRLTKDGRKIYVDGNGRPLTTQPRQNRGEAANPNDSKAGPAKDKLPGRASSGASSSNPNGNEGKPEDAKENLAAVAGRVVNELGEPVSGASVSVTFGAGSQPPRSAAANDEGRYRLENLPAQVPISVSASDSRGNASKPMNTRLAEGVTDLPDLVLPRETGVRGNVSSSESGGPVSGARVVLQIAEGWGYRDLKSTNTNDGGHFEFAPLTPGSYRLRITCDGFTPRIMNNVASPADLQIQLSPGVAISGVITDESGKPVAGALIYCDFHAEPNQQFHTESASLEDGSFAVKCQPESVHNSISVIAAGFGKFTQNFVRSGVSDLVIKLKRSANALIRGRLVNQSYQPITSAAFAAYKSDGKTTTVLQAIGPDSFGGFWCEVRLDASQLGIKAAGLPQRRVAIAPVTGEELDLGEIVLFAGVTLFGKVTREGTTAAISGAKVSAEDRNSTTDAAGSYRLDGLPTTDFMVSVQHPAYLGYASHVTPTQGQTEIEFNIELRQAQFEARVHVADAANNESLEGVAVSLPDYGMTLITDASGNAKITGLSSLDPFVTFGKSGFVTQTVEVHSWLASEVQAKPPTEVKLQRGSGIRGRCTTLGAPVAGGTELELWALDAKGTLTRPAPPTVQIDSDGRYATSELPPGTYFLGMLAHHVGPRQVQLPAEGGATLDFEIGAICNLRGVLKRADGSAHANQGIYVHNKANLYHCATVYTGPGGEFEVLNLWADTFSLTPLKTQGDSSAQFTLDVTLQAAGWTEKTLTLPQATGVVEGRVTYTDGAPVKKARVSITNLSVGWERACLAAYVVTDDDGRYRAERMENGCDMLARVGGYGDEADTATAFSNVVSVPNNGEPVQADIVVARSGVTVSGKVRRADGGPLPAYTILYLVDAAGRLSGLYFGGTGGSGNFSCGDVPPGTYRLMACNESLKRAEITVVVQSAQIANLEIIMDVHR